MDETTVKLVAGIGCLILVGIIILRRKNKKKTAVEDDF
jgi:LPXTG-motif cell wall-anchored protein